MSVLARTQAWERPWRLRGQAPTPATWSAPAVAEPGAHPLADASVSLALRRRAEEITAAFDAIEPALRALAPRQFDEGFAARAAAELRAGLGLDFPPSVFAARWNAPLDLRALHGRCVIATFERLIARAFDRGLAALSDGESAEALIRRWGFHAIDISPCADGRLSGVTDYILRVPPAVVAFRESCAGAMFDPAESVRHWEQVELGRWREAVPNPADAPTRFLKIGVYHFSGGGPAARGCAAHGGDGERAAAALAQRLAAFVRAVRNLHGEDAAVASLLVGVDTDTDAIRVHVPRADGEAAVDRFVDALVLHRETAGLGREAAKDHIRAAVAANAGVAADDTASEGMRWFCGYLLKNNIAQVEAVRARHGGAYPDLGHTERLIVVGDAVDDVQLRNLAFQARMDSLEAGVGDFDIGLHILQGLNAPRGLAVPVLVHVRADPRIPGSIETGAARAGRLAAAIRARHADLAARGGLVVEAIVREGESAILHPAEAGR